MRKEFHPFFMECSLKESNTVTKSMYERMAFNDGVCLMIKRGTKHYLSLDGNSEFTIPNSYDRNEHAKLTRLIGDWKNI